MDKNYPGESVSSADFYAKVGKSYVELATNFPESYQNTCAARMSYALNRSGLKLPVAPSGGNLKGDDGFNYWLRVAQLSKKLRGQFGAPDRVLDHTSLSRADATLVKERVDKTKLFLLDIASQKGIVVFEVSGWTDASGHFTLWDGKDLKYVGSGDHNNPASYEYYFWFLRVTTPDKVVAQTKRVLFWELK